MNSKIQMVIYKVIGMMEDQMIGGTRSWRKSKKEEKKSNI